MKNAIVVTSWPLFVEDADAVLVLDGASAAARAAQIVAALGSLGTGQSLRLDPPGDPSSLLVLDCDQVSVSGLPSGCALIGHPLLRLRSPNGGASQNVRVANSPGFRVAGLRVDGNRRGALTTGYSFRNSGNIVLDNCQGGLVERCEVTGSFWHAVLIRNSSNATIRNCRVLNWRYHALMIVESTDVYASRIFNARMEDNLLIGSRDTVTCNDSLYARNCEGVVMRRNRISGGCNGGQVTYAYGVIEMAANILMGTQAGFKVDYGRGVTYCEANEMYGLTWRPFETSGSAPARYPTAGSPTIPAGKYDGSVFFRRNILERCVARAGLITNAPVDPSATFGLRFGGTGDGSSDIIVGGTGNGLGGVNAVAIEDNAFRTIGGWGSAFLSRVHVPLSWLGNTTTGVVGGMAMNTQGLWPPAGTE